MRFNVFASTKIALIVLFVLFCSIPLLADVLTISDAKRLTNDQSVTLSAKLVTYTGDDFFYIEEDSRLIGIRVEKTAHDLDAGMRVDISGTMKTSLDNRERYILATSAVQTPEPNGYGVVTPVGMNNFAVGGDDWKVVGTGGQMEASNSRGLNNIGLLVRTWGKYQKLDDITFSVDDGSGLFIKCTVPSGTFLYSDWEYVCVTGISSMYRFNSTIFPPNILVRDIDVMLPAEVVTVPGKPSGNLDPLVEVDYPYSTTVSTCSQGHPVEYSFDWDDDDQSEWSTSTSATHKWTTPGVKLLMSLQGAKFIQAWQL